MGIYPDGRPYYAMRLIRGESLAEAIESLHRPDTPHSFEAHRALRRRLIRRFIGVCEAIAYAHSRGVLHRDLKPANIMLGPYGETLVVDWGLAKIADEREPHDPSPRLTADLLLSEHDEAHPTHTQVGSTLGTPAFMSPEQARAEHDRLGPASDIFGLGATLFQLITGALPYQESQARPLAPDGDATNASDRTQADTLEQQLVDAGLLLLDRGDTRIAEQLFREAMALDTRRRRGDAADRLGARIGLALVLQAQGKPDAALPLLRQTVEARRARFGPGDPLTASAESALGEPLLERGEFAEARVLLERSFPVLEASRDDLPRAYRWAIERRSRLREQVARAEHGEEMHPSP